MRLAIQTRLANRLMRWGFRLAPGNPKHFLFPDGSLWTRWRTSEGPRWRKTEF